jgi:hypothetical protein
MMTPVLNVPACLALVLLVGGGCGKEAESGDGETSNGPGIGGSITLDSGGTIEGSTGGSGAVTEAGTGGSGGTGGTDGTDSVGASATEPELKFDVGEAPDAGPVDTGMIDCQADPMNPDCMCTIPEHVPCDNGVNNPFQAMGLNCPGELQVNAQASGDAGAIGVRSTFGQAGIFNAREGSQYAVIGSGLVADLNMVTPNGDFDAGPTHCNDTLGGSPDPGNNLPAPIKINPAAGDCSQGQGIGTGDCSNTIQAQFQQGGGAYDYTELRFTLQVPPDVTSFSYDFAFFSTEYPAYYGSGFNDMYIGWLESEKWTGNISFDQDGNPISLNAGFLAFKDDGGNSPVLAGTCMRQHAGTNWLTTTAGVTPGETITVVFAIFDLSDPILDSYAFIDNFQWGCEPTGKPQTMPPV